MKFLGRLNAAFDWTIQILYTVIEFLIRLVALVSLPALVVWVILASTNLLLDGAIAREWIWLFPTMTVVQIIGLDSNLICLLADAAQDRLPKVPSERALRPWKIRQMVRAATITLTMIAIILPLVLIDSSPILPGPVPAWLAALRTLAIIAIVVLNVVLSPMVRRRVHADLASFQELQMQGLRARIANARNQEEGEGR
jgi:hypothetical protein